MKWSLLLNLVLITLVAGDGAWKQNKEYKYKVLIKTLTTSPKFNNRWIGTVLRGRLLINPQSENLLIGTIDDAEYAEIELSQKWDVDFNDDELSYNKRQLNRPFKIHLENGVIHSLSLSVDRTMTKDLKIQLKAIVSQLQVDTNKVESVSNNAFYKTTERTVTGNCETTYDISPLPDYLVQSNSDLIPMRDLKGEGDIINVVKTRDHNKCTERYGIVNERNEYRIMDNNVVHSETSRIVLSGSLKDYTIQSSVTTNQVIYNDLQSFTNIHYVNLKLESMEESTSRSSMRPQIQVGYNLQVEQLSVFNDLRKNDRYSNSNELTVTSNDEMIRSNEDTFRSNEDTIQSNEETFRYNKQMIRSNEQMIRSNDRLTQGMPRDSGEWSTCYTWFVGSEEMCRQSFNAEYSAESVENCNFLGHRSFCVRKYPGCESSVCWSAAIQDVCTKEFGDRLPVQKGGYIDCAPGFARKRCCPN